MNNETFRSISQSVKFYSPSQDDDQDDEQQKPSFESTQPVQEHAIEISNIGAHVLAYISSQEFNTKYGVDYSSPPYIHNYLFTTQPRLYTYVFEAFASVRSVSPDAVRPKKESMIFHPMFEDIIERYTKTRAKPNPVLMETRSSEFCYRLNIVVEAVPTEVQNTLGFGLSSLRLFREFEILKYVWEKYRVDLQANRCAQDHMVGIPMPFEFVNIEGTEYDFVLLPATIHYFDMHGTFVPTHSSRLPPTDEPLKSFLSYMSLEKLGPSLAYLADLMRSQKKWFTVSTALKLLDQLLCRLMVLHRAGVILGNLDLKYLNFGVREALNVLYVNNFDCAVVVPSKYKPLLNFNERYASTGVIRGSIHFVNDIESAFYIFLALLVPRLPWDERDASEQRDGSWSPGEKNRNMKLHQEERLKLWDSGVHLERLLHSYPMNTENNSAASLLFALDIIHTVYLKTKEAISTCGGISQQEFMANTMTVNTPANSAYVNIRKVIVSYFRFESLSGGLRDAVCQNKVDRLIDEDAADNRALWDLNEWCWNAYEPACLNGRRGSIKSALKSCNIYGAPNRLRDALPT